MSENVRPTTSSECRFAEEGVQVTDDGKKLRVVANSGQPILNHWAWGNLAIDLDGIEIGRQDKPILRDHDPKRAIGYTTGIRVEEGVGLVAEGRILSLTNEGREVSEAAAEGFPWQASIYIPPSEVEEVPAGESVEVNGYTLDGPGHVFRKSRLREVTVTTLGADESTSAALFGGKKDEEFTVPVTKHENDPSPAEVSLSNDAEVVSWTTTGSVPGAQFSQEDIDVAVAQAIEADRKRLAAFREAAFTGQESLVDQLHADGVELAEGLQKIIADQKTRGAETLSQIEREAPVVGFSETVEEEGVEDETVEDDASVEARATAAFNSSEHGDRLRAEFGTLDIFLSYVKGVEAGSWDDETGVL